MVINVQNGVMSVEEVSVNRKLLKFAQTVIRNVDQKNVTQLIKQSRKVERENIKIKL